MKRKDLQKELLDLQPTLERFMRGLNQQLLELMASASIVPATSMEHRIKTWESIDEKLDRRTLRLKGIRDLSDLVGVRCIFLFARDLETIAQAVASTFEIVSEENTAARLDEKTFGYQSLHYLIRVPAAWLKLPMFRNCEGLTAELQLRTLAQHMWAAASHKLQYKREASVPAPVRRSIHRVSALLETVDLEFERVLTAREEYLAGKPAGRQDEALNVDLLKTIARAMLPARNRS
ncbi:MAG TPA: RelA/SpoT domain-containing protein, partial [Polyangia bacterium]